jgi:hypothetical protein
MTWKAAEQLDDRHQQVGEQRRLVAPDCLVQRVAALYQHGLHQVEAFVGGKLEIGPRWEEKYDHRQQDRRHQQVVGEEVACPSGKKLGGRIGLPGCCLPGGGVHGWQRGYSWIRTPAAGRGT